MPKAEKAPRQQVFGYTPWRRAWMEAHRLAVVLYTALPHDDSREGFVTDDRHFGADPVVIEVRRGRRILWIDLTSLTEEELLMFRDILNTSIDTALPVCRYIDKAAQEATESGDTFSPRPFRIRPVQHSRWDGKITIPDNYQEHKHHEQIRSSEPSSGPPEVEG